MPSARIEITVFLKNPQWLKHRALYEHMDRNPKIALVFNPCQIARHLTCADWNIPRLPSGFIIDIARHRTCADRNIHKTARVLTHTNIAPMRVCGSKWGRKTDWRYYPVPHLYGAWIEIKQIRNSHLYVAPIRACGLKLHSQYDCMQPPKVAPLQVCVCWNHILFATRKQYSHL